MLRPIQDQMLVLPDPPPDRLANGTILFPEMAQQDNPNWFSVTGRVVRLGRQAFMRERRGQRDFGDPEYAMPFSVAVGDRVTFNRYAGHQVTDPETGVRYLVLRDCEVLAVVEGAAQLIPGYHEAVEAEVTETPVERA